MKRKLIAAGGLALALGACSSPDRAIFVTSTNLGINADPTTRVVNIGFDRTEGFIGPNYVEHGHTPEVVGYIQSDMAVLAPTIKQLYATGKAARVATNENEKPSDAPQTGDRLPAYGERRIMFFGTSSTIGLKAAFTPEQAPNINFGYKRKEVSIIPFQYDNPKDRKSADIYASVLASIDIKGDFGASPTIKNTQFFATGQPAEHLAETLRGTFKGAAQTAAAAAAAKQ
jgi:hypothetical protein